MGRRDGGPGEEKGAQGNKRGEDQMGRRGVGVGRMFTLWPTLVARDRRRRRRLWGREEWGWGRVETVWGGSGSVGEGGKEVERAHHTGRADKEAGECTERREERRDGGMGTADEGPRERGERQEEGKATGNRRKRGLRLGLRGRIIVMFFLLCCYYTFVVLLLYFVVFTIFYYIVIFLLQIFLFLLAHYSRLLIFSLLVYCYDDVMYC